MAARRRKHSDVMPLEHPRYQAMKRVAERRDAASMQRSAEFAMYLRDHRLAAQWWREGAKEGHPEAQFMFGEALRQGRGITRDQAEAARWYARAAAKGHVRARAWLGEMYEKGWGVPRDPARARQLRR